ncbi:MAG TPA: hypothetical protein VNZ61_03040 [Roseomonas sp.]|nr:hypothetical protein [Roseomonas sp.]
MRLAAQSFVILGLMASPALAQMWPNETGPGGDLFGTSARQFDRLQQAAPQPLGLPSAAAEPPRATIPMLDWTPPPPAAPQPAPKRQVRRRSPVPQATDRQAWERRLNERERELEAQRQRLEEERRRFEAQRTTTP